VVDAIVSVAESRGITPAQVALSYSLATPGVTSVIVGARTEAQLRDTLATPDVVLDRDERERVDRVSATPLPYPMWHQVINASDRCDRSIVGSPGSTAGARATRLGSDLVAFRRSAAQSVGLRHYQDVPIARFRTLSLQLATWHSRFVHGRSQLFGQLL